MRAAAGMCSIFLGLGFGVPGILGALHHARTGEVWTFLGFPTYGEGPFERFGIHTGVPLLLGFVLVCALEVVVGILLFTSWDAAPLVSHLLLPFELAFWVGFALPLGPLLGIPRTLLLLLA